MFPTFALMLTLAQPAEESIVVRPTRGQEFVYRGQFTEESHGATPTRQTYDLEARTFVLEADAKSAEVAFLTMFRAAGASPDTVGSARLDHATVDTRGRVQMLASGAAPRVPLDGPPTLEPAGFIELPGGPINSPWDTADGRRPPREWRVLGEESNGVRCSKLVGVQESANWQQPTGDAPAWRRTDVVWLATATGTVRRLERTIERRAGGDGSAGYTSHLEYELKSALTSPESLAADCRREIQLGGEVNRRLAQLAHSGRDGPAQFQQLQTQIDRRLVSISPTPYRPAIIALQHRVTAAARGEVPPPTGDFDPPTPPPAVGRIAPDFVTTNLKSGATLRLARWRSRPVVLLFVRPDSAATSQTMAIAADLQKRYADRLCVAVLVMSDEERVRPAWSEFGVPLFAGRDAAALYAVSGPSWAVVLDAAGVVRHLGDTGPGVIGAVQQVVAPVSGN